MESCKQDCLDEFRKSTFDILNRSLILFKRKGLFRIRHLDLSLFAI